MDRKIGVLTFHRTSNFGSSLQAYGLYEKIRDLGIRVKLLTIGALQSKKEKI